MRLMSIAALVVAMLSGCTPQSGEQMSVGQGLEQEVTSWLQVDAQSLDAMNQLIDEAVAKGESWPRTPMQITARLLGDEIGWRQLTLFEHRELGEGAQETIITFKQEGLMDDSVRAIIEQRVYHITEDGTWRITDSKRAFRCQRGSVNVDKFGAQLCS